MHKDRIVVAISRGVDSSVAAAKLKMIQSKDMRQKKICSIILWGVLVYVVLMILKLIVGIKTIEAVLSEEKIKERLPRPVNTLIHIEPYVEEMH